MNAWSSSGSSDHGDTFVVSVDRIRPGDVLVGLLKDPEAPWVARFAKDAGFNPSHSHAALFTCPVELFESTSGGICHCSLRRGKVVIDGIECEVVLLPPEYKTVELYRLEPPISQEEFKKLYLEILGQMWGKEYPPYSWLATATRFRPLSDLVLTHQEAKHQSALRENGPPLEERFGAFCSELVARFFSFGSKPLFEQQCQPNTVSPAMLAKSSNLKEVAGVVVRIREASVSILPAFGEYDSGDDVMVQVRALQIFQERISRQVQQLNGLHLPPAYYKRLKKIYRIMWQNAYNMMKGLFSDRCDVVAFKQDLQRLESQSERLNTICRGIAGAARLNVPLPQQNGS